MTSTIFDLVGESIVAADRDRELIVTWNHSRTVNVYAVYGEALRAVDCSESMDQLDEHTARELGQQLLDEERWQG